MFTDCFDKGKKKKKADDRVCNAAWSRNCFEGKKKVFRCGETIAHEAVGCLDEARGLCAPGLSRSHHTRASTREPLGLSLPLVGTWSRHLWPKSRLACLEHALLSCSMDRVRKQNQKPADWLIGATATTFMSA